MKIALTRKHILAAALAATTLLQGCDRENGPAGSEVTREAVLAAFDNYATHVTAHDFEGVYESFAKSPNVVMVGSSGRMNARGSEELYSFFKNLLALPTTFSWEWTSTTVETSPDMAWIFREGYAIQAAPEATNKVPYRMTAVLRRTSDKWVLTHYHGSVPTANSSQEDR